MTQQTCSFCIMDTTDSNISFDDKGQCNHCTQALRRLQSEYLPNAQGQELLSAKLAAIKLAGKDKQYDCIIGLSGGTDSSYLAYKTKEWGLRPLIFHVDGGWNSATATENIHKLVEYLGYDFHTHTVDWEEMRELQVCYLKSGIANMDVPQDHAFFAVLFKEAEAFGIDFWLSGFNLASESILPSSWCYTALDKRQVSAIYRTFSGKNLQRFPTLSFYEYCKFYGNLPFVNAVKVESFLNLMPYNALLARKELAEGAGWQDYGKKHTESRFTKLYQNYLLPTKFGFDKRKAHYSSLIVSGCMTRDEAMIEMQAPLYEAQELREDIEYVREKLRLSNAEWDAIMAVPNKLYTDYPNYEGLKIVGRSVKKVLKKSCYKNSKIS